MDRIAISPLNAFKIPEGSIRKLSDEEASAFRTQTQDMLKAAHTRPVDYENYPANQPYATVEVNGKTVATLYNSGSAETSNAAYAQYGSKMPNDGQGPVLAQKRAEYLAKMLGGKVVKAGSALTQTQYSQLPPMEFKLDTAALMADPMYAWAFGNTQTPRAAASEEVKTDGVTAHNLAALLAEQEV